MGNVEGGQLSVKVLNDEVDLVMTHDILQIVGMGEKSVSQQCVIEEQRGNYVMLRVLSDLDTKLRRNIRISTRFDSFLYPVSGKCKGLAECLAGAVRMVMQTNDQWRTYQRWNSAHNADYYGVIRGASSVGVPGLIIEHSFHTNTRAAKWLQSAANLRKLAEAEAEVLAVEYGLSRKGCPFTDVKEGKWYYDDVLWAYENGITSGVSKDKFGVGQPCTREQVVAFLHNYDKYLENK
jgi:hypothetical protein